VYLHKATGRARASRDGHDRLKHGGAGLSYNLPPERHGAHEGVP
jgi:hypothetical protein